MAKSRQAWLAAPNVSWRWAVVAAFVWSAAVIGVYLSPVGSYLEVKLAQPTNFRLRALLGADLEMSPQLKVYGIDDKTFTRMGSWVLGLHTYAELFKRLAAREPRAIIVDSMFSKADGSGEDAAAIAAIRELRAKVPIVIASYVTESRLKYRDDLTLNSTFSLAAFAGRPPGTVLPADDLPPMLDLNGWHAYGPSPEMQASVGHIGHFMYNGSGSVAPIIRLGDDTGLLHFSLFAAKERRLAHGRLLVDGVPVPVDADGATPINFVATGKFWENFWPLRPLLAAIAETPAAPGSAAEAADGDDRGEVPGGVPGTPAGAVTGLKDEGAKRSKDPYDKIEKGDVVLILPLMYTGNTDFKTTPFGNLPAGYVIASMINSTLTGEFLHPLFHGEWLVAGAAFAGAALAVRTGALVFWMALGLGLGGGFFGAIWLFAMHGIVVPWLFPGCAFLGAAISVFAEKTRVGERKVQALRVALEGAVAPQELKSILKHPERVALEARERVVTLMFIDVVGFSLLAENMLPRMAFENLKKMLTNIGETVHQFGGVIDKTLGDGLLCYFGYRFDSDTSAPDHAEKALRCAIKIQRDNLAKNLEASAQGEPVYPLRIGVNTSSCYLGDLGTSSRIDFTVVGNGVNFAKRLEGACEMHSILMGATTQDLIRGIGLPVEAVTRRFIRIKHHSELVEAHEYDPFYSEPDLRLAAIEGFRKCANIERVDQRWPVHDPSKIQLQCDFGAGQLVNFSHTGLSIRLPQLLAKGTRLNIALDSAGGALKSLLAKEGISILQGEVRWGYSEGGEFVHGVLLSNISDTQSDALVQYLCEIAFARESLRNLGLKGEGNGGGASSKAS